MFMLKRLVKIFLILLACSLVLVSVLPMLVSISRVNQFLLSCINSRIAGKLHAEELQVGWTNGLYVKGLEVQDPQGREVASFKAISCDVSLLSLNHAPA